MHIDVPSNLPRLVGLLAAAAGLLFALATVQAESMEVTDPEVVWRGQTIEADGNLTVRNGSVLRVEGTTLQVAGALVVEPGAELILGPWEGQATRLEPANGSTDFVILVDGLVRSQGEPRTEVTGLGGNVLAGAVLDEAAGLRIGGRAELQDLHVHDGWSGILVRPGGHLVLEDAAVDRMGILGVVVQGGAEMRRVHMEGNQIAFAARGRDAWANIEDCRLASTAANLQNVGARVSIQRCELFSPNNNLVVEGTAPRLFVNESRVHGYGHAGLTTRGNAYVELRDVEFQGGPEAKWGHRAAGRDDEVHMRNVTWMDHRQNGLFGQATSYAFDGVRIVRSGLGVQMADGRFLNGLDGVAFGTGPDANEQGDVSFQRRVAGVVQDAATGAQLLGGTLVIEDSQGQELARSNLTERPYVAFEAYTSEAGRPVPLQGLRYRLEHPLLVEPLSGALASDDSLVLAEVAAPDAGRNDSLPLMASSAMLLAGVLLLAYAVSFRRVRRRVERRQDEEGLPRKRDP